MVKWRHNTVWNQERRRLNWIRRREYNSSMWIESLENQERAECTHAEYLFDSKSHLKNHKYQFDFIRGTWDGRRDLSFSMILVVGSRTKLSWNQTSMINSHGPWTSGINTKIRSCMLIGKLDRFCRNIGRSNIRLIRDRKIFFSKFQKIFAPLLCTFFRLLRIDCKKNFRKSIGNFKIFNIIKIFAIHS